MPPKKKTAAKAASPAPAPSKSGLCGHLNKQHTGIEVLTCKLPKGHEGDHQAPYLRLAGDGFVEEMGFWSDAAGE